MYTKGFAFQKVSVNILHDINTVFKMKIKNGIKNTNNFQSFIFKKYLLLESNECEVCKKNFRTAKILKNHQKVNHKIQDDEANSKTVRELPKKLNEVLECVVCGIEFDSVKKYNTHMITMKHRKVKIFCEFCNKQLNIEYYEQHVLLKHNGGNACNICDEKFDSKEVCVYIHRT